MHAPLFDWLFSILSCPPSTSVLQRNLVRYLPKVPYYQTFVCRLNSLHSWELNIGRYGTSHFASTSGVAGSLVDPKSISQDTEICSWWMVNGDSLALAWRLQTWTKNPKNTIAEESNVLMTDDGAMWYTQKWWTGLGETPMMAQCDTPKNGEQAWVRHLCLCI